jgi:prepilin-type N-terminal cleavage/methylation domain-containing protein
VDRLGVFPRRRPRRRSLPGFTLIELIVVIVIIGILAAVALTSYTTFVENTRRSAAAQVTWQVSNALQACSALEQLPPAAVTAVWAPGPGQEDLAEECAGSNLGNEVTSYRLADSGPGSRALTVVMQSGYSCTGLVFTTALVAASPSGEPDCSEAVPSGAPSGFSLTPGNTQVGVAWTPDPDEPGDGYSVSWTDGVVSGTTSSASSPITVTGLTNGVSYTFTVTALGLAGNSPPVSSVVTPYTTPSAPTGVVVTAGASSLLVSWDAPASDGGSPVTGYTATAFPGGASCATAGLSCTIPGLTDGTLYTVTVTAANAAGSSAGSPPSAATAPYTVPGAPTGVSATPGDGQAVVSWVAPADDGGSAVTGYTVTSSPGSFQCSTAGLSCTVTGLTNDTSYTFTVVAGNAAGSSSSSAASAAATPILPFNSASGGTVTDVANYNGTGETWRVHRFTGNGTFTITGASREFRVLVVGAGQDGGGTSNDCCTPDNRLAGPGGSGGRFLADDAAVLSVGAQAVTVGSTSSSPSLLGVLSSASGAAGGSGGARGGPDQDGQPGSVGVSSNISGSSVGYAGGGGGGGNDRTAGSMGGGGVGGGAGAAGGGSGGGAYSDCCSFSNGGAPGSSAAANRGSGGGGAGVVSFGHNVTDVGHAGGSGGSGVVIVAYRIA